MIENIEFDGYQLTNDTQLLDKQNGITPENTKYVLKAYELGASGTKKDIITIKDYIKKYPKVPSFKNYLSTLYEKTGDLDKAIDVCEYTYQQHPDYLLGRTNLANIYFNKKKYEKIEKMLGEKMELRELFPNRKVFHIDEYVAFQKAAALYFAGIYKDDEADARIQKIWELDYNTEIAEQAEALIFKLNLERHIYIDVEDNPNQIKVIGDKVDKKDIDYKFNNVVFEKIHRIELLDKETTDEIMKMPEDKLIQDLKYLIESTIQAYHYGDDFNEKALRVFHATIIFAELESHENLNFILDIFRQDKHFIDTIFEDVLTEFIWICFYKLGHNKIDILKEFMFEPGRHPFVKTEIAKTMEQLVYHQPSRKNEVENWFKDVFEFFINQSPDDNTIEAEMIGLIIAHAIELRFEKLFPLIEKLYEMQYATPGICGSLESIKEDISSDLNKRHKEYIPNINQFYREIEFVFEMADPDFLDEFDDEFDDELDMFDEFDEGIYEDDDYSPEFDKYFNKPIIKEKKIGRNEPCPCGSGKKYKKCCLNK